MDKDKKDIKNKESNKKTEKGNEGAGGSIKDFVIKHKRYVTGGVVAGLLVVALIVSGSMKKEEKSTETANAQNASQETADQNASGSDITDEKIVAEVTQMFKQYYTHYAKGDITSLEKVAYPVSETEKSYIELLSRYIEKYDEVECHVKKGATEDEHVVFVRLKMKFKGIEKEAPGLDCFYVKKDSQGTYYIANEYSQMNQANQETATDAEVVALISDYAEQEDVVALKEDVEAACSKAKDEDADLKTMIDETMPNVISGWVTSVGKAQQQDGSGAEGTDKKDDSKKDDSKKDDSKKDDSKKDDSKKDDSKKADSQKEDDANKTDGSDAQGASDADGSDSTKSEDSSKTKVKERTAYAKTKVNLRKKKSINSDVVVTLDNGAEVMVLGKSSKGWFRVDYGDKSGYVKKEYIVFDKSQVESEEDNSTDNGGQSSATDTAGGREVLLSESVNIRVSMSETADRLGLAYMGEKVTVVMEYDNGWSKVSWNGKTGYAKTEFLK